MISTVPQAFWPFYTPGTKSSMPIFICTALWPEALCPKIRRDGYQSETIISLTQKRYLWYSGGKFIECMSHACLNEKINLTGNAYKNLKKKLYTKNWVVSVRDPVKSPNMSLNILHAIPIGWPLPTAASKNLKTAW